MTKIVVNNCFGGFGLSRAAQGFLQTRGIDPDGDLARDNPALVEAVETLGDAASGYCAELRVVEIPDDVDWAIMEYDGSEWVAERHRTWRADA